MADEDKTKSTEESEAEQIKKWWHLIVTFDEKVSDKWDADLVDRCWQGYRSYYHGTTKYEDMASLVGVNLVYSYVDVQESAISKTRPKLYTQARDMEAEATVNPATAAADYEIREMKFKRRMDDGLLDMFLDMRGAFWKIGWHTEFGDPPTTAKSAPSKSGDPDGIKGKDGDNVEFVVKKDHSFLSRISPNNIKFDPNAEYLDEASWIAVRSRRTVEDVENDRSYIPEAVSKAVGKVKQGSSNLKKYDKEIEIWEVWDARKREVIVFADVYREGFLRKKRPWPFKFMDGPPFVHKVFNRISGQVYGMAPVPAFFNEIEGMNRLQTNAIEKSSGTVPKYLTDETPSPEMVAALESIHYNELIVTKKGQSIEPLQFTNMPSDEHRLAETHMQNYRMVSGVAEQQLGVGAKETITATESLARQQFSMSRMEKMRSKFSEAWEEVARKLIQMIRQFYKPWRYIPIYDKADRVVDSTQWTSDWAEAEYDVVQVEVGSIAPLSKEAKQQQFLQTSNALIATMQGIANVAAAWQSVFQINIKGLEFARQMVGPFDDIEVDKFIEDLDTIQTPEMEHTVLLNGGNIFMMPDDNHEQHYLAHVRDFYQQLQSLNANGTIPDEDGSLASTMIVHIQEHLAAIQMTNPADDAFGATGAQQPQQQQQLPPGGTDPSMALQAGGEGLSPSEDIGGGLGAKAAQAANLARSQGSVSPDQVTGANGGISGNVGAAF